MSKVAQRATEVTVHVKVGGVLLEQLDKMCAADRRDRPDFVRLLIEDEWARRAAKENGAQA
jgi:hypothetical protein